MTKVCTKCHEEKLLTEFYFHKTGKDAGRPYCRCKPCSRVSALAEFHKKELDPVHRECRRERQREYQKSRYVNEPDYRERRLANTKKYDESPKGRESARKAKVKYRKTPNGVAHRKKDNAKLQAKGYFRKYMKKRRNADPVFNFITTTRNLINSSLAGRGQKSTRSAALLGCPIADFRAHIESHFWPGMSWQNQGQWHLDHIKPCASFDLRDPAQQAVCFHWSNWQPLWADDNLAKSDRLNWTPAESKHTQ